MHRSPSHPIRPTTRRRRAFTLVELMISIALALVLIYGISQVFKLSGDTVGANTAISNMTRDYRAAQATMLEDFRNSLPDSPLFLISNRIAYGYVTGAANSGYKAGFKNADDERDEGTNADPLGATFLNGSQVPSPSVTAGTDRAPRLDRMGFFVRNLYRRQTASSNQVSSSLTSTDAYVWYGHAALPPADGSTDATPWIQPHDQYAADRILARTAILMKSGTPEEFAAKGEDPLNPRGPIAAQRYTALWPLGYATPVHNKDDIRRVGPLNQAAAYQSVKDLAPIGVEEFREMAGLAYADPAIGPFAWFRHMEDPNPALGQFWRAYVRPTVARPVDQVKLAQTAPFFVGHCTQFIVEYAGDYLNQNEFDPNVPGLPIDAAVKMNPRPPPAAPDFVYGQTDGKIDYVIDTSGDGQFNPTTGAFQIADPPNNPARWVRRVRWYGLPRDVTGDGAITVNDVVPLSDVMAYYKVTMAAPDAGPAAPERQLRAVAPWEIDLPNTPTPFSSTTTLRQGLVNPTLRNPQLPRRTNSGVAEQENSQQDYAMLDRTGTKLDAAQRFLYTCAFRNDAPAMIRITMKLDDPNGRLRDGQWFQFVLTR